jgi:hypothetical protein
MLRSLGAGRFLKTFPSALTLTTPFTAAAQSPGCGDAHDQSRDIEATNKIRKGEEAYKNSRYLCVQNAILTQAVKNALSDPASAPIASPASCR